MSVARIDTKKFVQVAYTILYGGRDASNLKDVFYSGARNTSSRLSERLSRIKTITTRALSCHGWIG